MNRLEGSGPVFVYTVSDLTREIRDILESNFPSIWVEGEISNCHLHSSGHLYFTLKDDRAQIRAVMFRSQVQYLSFVPEDGMHVLCLGRLGVYEARGEYQLYLDFMEPRGVGALLLAFEQLKARLAREGLFNQERKRRIPFLPRVVGIVTSPTGAVIRDMLQILGRRFPNLQVVVRPVKVQGEGAAEEISQAIEDLNQWPGVDVIVVARGGGSLEDLWAFNEEKVARAIAASKVPVVSAVGHEVDYTIADFVADLRAPTPSAAAELIVPLKADLERAILDLRTRLLHAMEKNLKDRRAHVSNFMGRLQDPRRRVRQERLLLDELLSSLQRAMKAELKLKRSLLEQRAAVLETLSPLKILGRGYSIVRRHPQREIIREASSLSKGDLLDITFHRGTALCTVESASE
jgi:exodeoxyribonuclease VII large subunit